MSAVQMTIASLAVALFLDGTFAICPFPFFQVVFFTVKVGQNKYQIAAALLPNKLESTYREVFEKLKAECVANGTPMDLIYVHHDCEMAIINAVRFVFSTASIRLCRFHVVDAIRRHANSLGLRPLLRARGDLKKFYARIRQVFCFPPDLQPRVWTLLLSFLGRDTKELPPVVAFLDYLVGYMLFLLFLQAEYN